MLIRQSKLPNKYGDVIMGQYNLSPEEIEASFEEWLSSQEGDIQAWVLAEVWNRLAKKHGWSDTLKAKED